ncbi:MAG: hypothetical protein WCT04_02630 [Planctomycetota bacterium]
MNHFEELMSDYFEGVLDESALNELALIIEADDSLRERFLRQSEMNGLLYSNFTPPAAEAELVRRTMVCLPHITDSQQTVSRVMSRIERRSAPKIFIAEPKHARRYWIGALAGIAALLAIGFWLQNHTPSKVLDNGSLAEFASIKKLESAFLHSGGVIIAEPRVLNSGPGVTIAHIPAARNGSNQPFETLVVTVERGGNAEFGYSIPTIGNARFISTGEGVYAFAPLVAFPASNAASLIHVELQRGALNVDSDAPGVTIRMPQANAVTLGSMNALEIQADAGHVRLDVTVGSLRLERLADGAAVTVAAREFAVVQADAEFASRAVGTRDPALHPFDDHSPWNTPLGSEAVYAEHGSTKLDLSRGAQLNIKRFSQPIYTCSPGDPMNQLTRANNKEVLARMRIPDDAQPEPDYRTMSLIDETHAYAIELKGVDRPSAGVVRALNSRRTDLHGSGINLTPALNFCSFSSLAGTIRKGELAGGIRHALSVLVIQEALNGEGPNGPFIWPAVGNPPDMRFELAGQNGLVRLGSLLAIPADVDIAQAVGAVSGPVYEFARALQDYGAYVSGTFAAGNKPFVFNLEPSAAEDVPHEFSAALSKLVPLLKVVVNNAPHRIGGGGVPRRGLAPVFDRKPMKPDSVKDQF